MGSRLEALVLKLVTVGTAKAEGIFKYQLPPLNTLALSTLLPAA